MLNAEDDKNDTSQKIKKTSTLRYNTTENTP